MKTFSSLRNFSTLMSLVLITLFSVSAMACPKGTTLTGGTGPNHKGGKCIAIAKNQTAPKTAQPKNATTKTSPAQPSTTPERKTP